MLPNPGRPSRTTEVVLQINCEGDDRSHDTFLDEGMVGKNPKSGCGRKIKPVSHTTPYWVQVAWSGHGVQLCGVVR